MKESTRERGRPRIPPEDRMVTVATRMTAAQRAKLQDKADARDLYLSSYIRMVLLQHLGEMMSPGD